MDSCWKLNILSLHNKTHLVGAVAVANVAGEGERELSVQHDMADLAPLVIAIALQIGKVIRRLAEDRTAAGWRGKETQIEDVGIRAGILFGRFCHSCGPNGGHFRHSTLRRVRIGGFTP